jgi:hypothetical protein
MSKTPGIINKGKTEELHYQISKEEFDELYEKKYHK